MTRPRPQVLMIRVVRLEVEAFGDAFHAKQVLHSEFDAVARMLMTTGNRYGYAMSTLDHTMACIITRNRVVAPSVSHLVVPHHACTMHFVTCGAPRHRSSLVGTFGTARYACACKSRVIRHTLCTLRMVSLRSKILDFRGFDSSTIFILRGGMFMPGKFESSNHTMQSLGSSSAAPSGARLWMEERIELLAFGHPVPCLGFGGSFSLISCSNGGIIGDLRSPPRVCLAKTNNRPWASTAWRMQRRKGLRFHRVRSPTLRFRFQVLHPPPGSHSGVLEPHVMMYYVSY